MKNRRSTYLALVCSLVLLLPLAASAADSTPVDNSAGMTIEVDGLTFESSPAFNSSELFKAAGLRCSTPDLAVRSRLYEDIGGGMPTDCSATSTNPSAIYDSDVTYRIPVVIHILMTDDCNTGVISDAMVDSQIEIFNEDFQALAGSNGANGNNVAFEFYLATEDPNGDPHPGVTRTCNSTWYNDGGGYFNSLAWDPNRYINVYTNNGGGALGYVPFLPADGGGGQVGTNGDRIVILWNTFGRNAPNMPFHLGRTVTHEAGHYFGLEHTFSGGCATGTPPGCYSSGDLICDTNSESNPYFGCGADRSTCSSVDPKDNYMDYSDDICMEMFTVEQARRMRCTIENYRPDLFEVVVAGDPIFDDGFESGDTTSWSVAVP